MTVSRCSARARPRRRRPRRGRRAARPGRGRRPASRRCRGCPGWWRRRGRAAAAGAGTAARSASTSGTTGLPLAARAAPQSSATSNRQRRRPPRRSPRPRRRRSAPAAAAGRGPARPRRRASRAARPRRRPTRTARRRARGRRRTGRPAQSGEEDGLIRRPAGGCRSGSRRRSARATRVADGRARDERQHRVGRVGRGLVGEVDPGDQPRSSRPRAKTDTSRCGACAAPPGAGTGPGLTGVDPVRAVRRRSAQRPNPRKPSARRRVVRVAEAAVGSACQVSTSASGTGSPAPSMTRRGSRTRRASRRDDERAVRPGQPDRRRTARRSARACSAGSVVLASSPSSNGVASRPRSTMSNR